MHVLLSKMDGYTTYRVSCYEHYQHGRINPPICFWSHLTLGQALGLVAQLTTEKYYR